LGDGYSTRRNHPVQAEIAARIDRVRARVAIKLAGGIQQADTSLSQMIGDGSQVVASLVLDGKSTGRTVHVPLATANPRDGFVKLSFLYSGAATQDRCIDVRYVGDGVTIRPESAVGDLARAPLAMRSSRATGPILRSIIRPSPFTTNWRSSI
jgi:hypothetical protein